MHVDLFFYSKIYPNIANMQFSEKENYSWTREYVLTAESCEKNMKLFL